MNTCEVVVNGEKMTFEGLWKDEGNDSYFELKKPFTAYDDDEENCEYMFDIEEHDLSIDDDCVVWGWLSAEKGKYIPTKVSEDIDTIISDEDKMKDGIFWKSFNWA